MKTLILYATKYGAAEEIAHRIAKRIPDSISHNLKNAGIPPLTKFDCVVVGGSLYAGMLRKEAKTFISENEAALAMKKFGLFQSGMTPNEAEYEAYFKANFSENVLKCAIVKMFLGGIFDPAKANGFERFIYKIAAKQKDYANTISNEKIEEFVRALK